MSVLAVIPARGGSKSIPRKNIVDLCGKPLIVHTIDAALALSDRLHRVIVSTDDEEIASVSRAAGADVPFMRPAALGRDDTPSLPVVQHAARFVEEQAVAKLDWILLLQPTTPLRTAGDIADALDLTDDGTATSVVGVCDVGSYHPLKMYSAENGFLTPYAENWTEGIRRQDLAPDLYKTNGTIYLVRRDVLIEGNSLLGDRVRPLVMPAERSLDIDSELDLVIAEALIRRRDGT